MKTKKQMHALLLSLLALGGPMVGCSDDEETPEDRCQFESSGCGDPFLQFAIWDPLPAGEYKITVESSEGGGECSLTRSGRNEVNYALNCKGDDLRERARFDQYGLIFNDWLPETITVTIENVNTGCVSTQTETPVYKASWFECGETCIDALVLFEAPELRTTECISGMGGAGAGGAGGGALRPIPT